MTTYTARVSREGRWWMINVPDIDGLTQARRLNEAEAMARSLIAVTLDVPADSFGVRVELEAIEDLRVTDWLDQLEHDRRSMVEAQEQYRNRQRSLVRAMQARGLTVRDIGAALDISFQRVQQILDEPQPRRAVAVRSGLADTGQRKETVTRWAARSGYSRSTAAGPVAAKKSARAVATPRGATKSTSRKKG